MKRAVIWLLRVYKRLLSPMLLPACRYVPSCSEYAIETVGHDGVLHGSLKAAWRVLRCNPLARGGYDPVTPAADHGVSIADGERPARHYSNLRGEN
jgi:uncharacterized protein